MVLHSSGLAWNAMLKMTKVNLELISDNSVLEFFEQQMRGGVSTVFHRYAEANNKYLPNYNPKKESSYISYLDANNLYGWAMSKPLPTGNFKFMNKRNIDKTFNQLVSETFFPEEKVGKVFQVDIDYPTSLHDYHNDYHSYLSIMKIN